MQVDSKYDHYTLSHEIQWLFIKAADVCRSFTQPKLRDKYQPSKSGCGNTDKRNQYDTAPNKGPCKHNLGLGCLVLACYQYYMNIASRVQCLTKTYDTSGQNKPNPSREHQWFRDRWQLYLLLSCRASLPFFQEITPQGDILGLHSMSRSPPSLTRVWVLSWLWEKSGATAETVRACKNGKKNGIHTPLSLMYMVNLHCC